MEYDPMKSTKFLYYALMIRHASEQWVDGLVSGYQNYLYKTVTLIINQQSFFIKLLPLFFYIINITNFCQTIKTLFSISLLSKQFYCQAIKILF